MAPRFGGRLATRPGSRGGGLSPSGLLNHWRGSAKRQFLAIIRHMFLDPRRFVLRWTEPDIEMAFRLIPPGEFRMGSRRRYTDEEPCHLVTITDAFWLAETPVTQEQLDIWTRAEGIEHENYFRGHLEHPAEMVSWRDVIGYCEWVGRTMWEKLPEGYTLACLPTEAEWEYACRAGTETEYYTGDGEEALADAGWYGEDWENGSTHPVRLKEGSAFGLYDMHGNVWEWCHDVRDDVAYRQRWNSVRDPGLRERNEDWGRGVVTMLDDRRVRVLRGGSWNCMPFVCRSASRRKRRPDGRSRDCGFRLCLAHCPPVAKRESMR